MQRDSLIIVIMKGWNKNKKILLAAYNPFYQITLIDQSMPFIRDKSVLNPQQFLGFNSSEIVDLANAETRGRPCIS